MEGIEVRQAHQDELAAVGELTVAAYARDGVVREQYLPELRDAAARAAAGELLVAVETSSGDLLGTASLFTHDAGSRWAEAAGAGDAVLRMLAVSPSARRCGIGRALTVACIDLAREKGCRRLLLSTAPAMAAARGLYEQLGFQRDPGADWEPLPGARLLAYWLALGPEHR